MEEILIIVGGVWFVGSLIQLIIDRFRKKSLKRSLLQLAVSSALLIIGLILFIIVAKEGRKLP
jgi:hypothetical protein